MAAQIEKQASVLLELRTRVQKLRTELDDVAVLLDWELEHKIPDYAIENIFISPSQIAAERQWDNVNPDELVRLFLQTHTLATRLKYLVPPEEKPAVVRAVLETFHQIAARQNFEIPLDMDVTIGD